jgi:hypothetical protein
LEEVRDGLGGVGSDAGGGVFEADAPVCAGREDVGSGGPPVVALSVAGEVGEGAALVGVGDLVEVKQDIEVAGAGGGAAGLDPGQGGGGDAEPVGGVGEQEAVCFA